MNPVLSIVIISFRNEKTIGCAARSAADVQLKDKEIILVDWGTDDSVINKLKEEIKIKKIIRLNGNSEDCNEGFLRNQGLKAAEGKYILFLDGDDLLYPSGLPKLVKVMESNPELGFVFSNLDIGPDIGAIKTESKYKYPIIKYEGDIFRAMLQRNFMNMHSVLFHRERFLETGGFDSADLGHLDYAAELRMAAGYPARYVDVKNGFYRQYPGSLSKNLVKMKNSLVIIYERLLNDTEKQIGKRKLTRNNLFWIKYNLGKSYYYINEQNTARKYLKEALKIRPLALRIFFRLALSYLISPELYITLRRL